MKAKTRKRLLISSIAMLLVAMLALGTATFAWFTSSTTATTSGLAVHTTKSSKLQISSATSNWDTTINYNTGDMLLLPTSSIDGTHWYKANATVRTSYAATSYQTADNSGSTKYWYANQLNVKNGGESGDANINNIKIKMTWPSASYDTSYLRVALVEAVEKGANKDFATGAAFTDCIIAKDNTGYYPVYDNSGTATVDTSGDTHKITPTAGNTSSTAVVNIAGALAPGEAKYYNLYVWFEGQDTDCKDDNAGAAIPDIVFEVVGDTVISA